MLPEVQCLLTGIALFFILWGAIRFPSRKSISVRTAIAKTEYIRGFLLFAGTWFFVAVGIYITIKAGGSTVTSPELSVMAGTLYKIIWIVAGVFIGALALFLGEFFSALAKSIREERKAKRDEEIRPIARRIWEQKGCRIGYNLEDWREAQIEWKEQRKRKWRWLTRACRASNGKNK